MLINKQECPNCTYLYLLHAWSLEAQIKAVVCQRSDFHVVAIIAHADDGDLGISDKAD